MTKSETNKLDKLAREKARENYGKRCIICGNENVNIHHLEGRRIKSCRWYLPNLVPLCALHHTFGTFSAHQSPLRFYKAMLDLVGQKYLDDVQKQSLKIFKGTYQTVLDYLEGKIKNYV